MPTFKCIDILSINRLLYDASISGETNFQYPGQGEYTYVAPIIGETISEPSTDGTPADEPQFDENGYTPPTSTVNRQPGENIDYSAVTISFETNQETEEERMMHIYRVDVSTSGGFTFHADHTNTEVWNSTFGSGTFSVVDDYLLIGQTKSPAYEDASTLYPFPYYVSMEWEWSSIGNSQYGFKFDIYGTPLSINESYWYSFGVGYNLDAAYCTEEEGSETGFIFEAGPRYVCKVIVQGHPSRYADDYWTQDIYVNDALVAHKSYTHVPSFNATNTEENNTQDNPITAETDVDMTTENGFSITADAYLSNLFAWTTFEDNVSDTKQIYDIMSRFDDNGNYWTLYFRVNYDYTVDAVFDLYYEGELTSIYHSVDINWSDWSDGVKTNMSSDFVNLAVSYNNGELRLFVNGMYSDEATSSYIGLTEFPDIAGLIQLNGKIGLDPTSQPLAALSVNNAFIIDYHHYWDDFTIETFGFRGIRIRPLMKIKLGRGDLSSMMGRLAV